METIKLYHGDCLEIMKSLDAGSVDLVLTDPPYGTTACKWDVVIPFEPMWERIGHAIKPNAAICLFGSEPFSSALRMSNIKKYKYDWIWEKSTVGGFLNCHNAPLKCIENICVFSDASIANGAKTMMAYNPQNIVVYNKTAKNSKRNQNGTIGVARCRVGDYFQEFTNYPKNVLKFDRDADLSHPTQKPVALLEYLIKTYTNEGDTVLDFTMGSGSTGVACVRTGRKFIGVEKDDHYFEVAKKRIEEAASEPNLFREEPPAEVQAVEQKLLFS